MSAVKILKFFLVFQSVKRSNCYRIEIRNNSTKIGREIQIPVPWGYVRGKWWGCTKRRPILAIPGWLDNCGTFNNLAPLLAEKLQIGFLAIDLPGHGLSSGYPIGTYYHLPDSVILIHRIKKFMGWTHCSLLGHSLGSSSCFVYSSYFGANTVDFLITIDRLLPPFKEHTNALKYGKIIENYLRYETIVKEQNTISYSYDEGLKKLLTSNYLANVNEKNARFLLERQFVPSNTDPDRFVFNTDPRIKSRYLVHWDAADCLLMAKKLSMPILNLKTDISNYYDDEETFKSVCNLLKCNNKHFRNLEINATHFAHLTTPEQIVEPIVNFVSEFDMGNRDQKKDIFEQIHYICDK